MKSFYQVINEENIYTELREVDKRISEIDAEKEQLIKKRETLLNDIKGIESSGGSAKGRKFIIAKNVRKDKPHYYLTVDEGSENFRVVDKNLNSNTGVSLPKEYTHKITQEEKEMLLNGTVNVHVAKERFGEYKLSELGLTEKDVLFT